MSALFIILVSLGMTSFSEKVLISNRCIGRGDVSTPSFGSHPNPISTRGAGYAHPILVSTPGFESHRRWGNRLCPLHYPQVFRRSYGPAITDSEVVVKRNFILLSFFCCFCSSPLLAEVIMFRLEHQSQIMRHINCHIECFELMRMSGLGLFKVAEVEGGLWIKK